VIRAVAIAALLTGCALDDRLPPSPQTAAHRAEDRRAAQLEAHLRGLPGVLDVAVVVALPVDDPLAPPRPARPRAAVALSLDARADRGVVARASSAAARTLLGAEVELAVELVPAPTFAVTKRRARAVPIVVAIAVAAIALTIALGLARVRAQARHRGISAQ